LSKIIPSYEGVSIENFRYSSGSGFVWRAWVVLFRLLFPLIVSHSLRFLVRYRLSSLSKENTSGPLPLHHLYWMLLVSQVASG